MYSEQKVIRSPVEYMFPLTVVFVGLTDCHLIVPSELLVKLQVEIYCLK